MTCVKLNKDNAEFQKLDRIIREYYTRLANTCLKELCREIPYYMSYLESRREIIGYYIRNCKRQFTVELLCATWLRNKRKAMEKYRGNQYVRTGHYHESLMSVLIHFLNQ